MDVRDTRAFVDFLEAAYRLDTDDLRWSRELLMTARKVTGYPAAHIALYDASDVADFRLIANQVAGPTELQSALQVGLGLFTPAYVARTFRSMLVSGSSRKSSTPELTPMFTELERIGLLDGISLNGLDPGGVGVLVVLWRRRHTEPRPEELAVYRRMAHHLAAAYRCRRRLSDGEARVDPIEGAEAVLDATGRVLHAEGDATGNGARAAIVRAAKARDLARTSSAKRQEGLRGWWPLTSARWTLVDGFERSGHRYVVARENQARVRGLAGLSDRERQVVAYMALGQTTKEIAYALGIADTTVRVLIARAAGKLGVQSRVSLLEHPEVRALRPLGASKRVPQSAD